MENYEFIFEAPKEEVIVKLFSDLAKTDTYYERNPLRGKICKGRKKIRLWYKTPTVNRRGFCPIFVADILEEGQKTIVRGKWKFKLQDYIFSFFYFAFLLYISILPHVVEGEGNFPLLYAVVAFFAIFYVVLRKICTHQEKEGKEKVIAYIKGKQ